MMPAAMSDAADFQATLRRKIWGVHREGRTVIFAPYLLFMFCVDPAVDFILVAGVFTIYNLVSKLIISFDPSVRHLFGICSELGYT